MRAFRFSGVLSLLVKPSDVSGRRLSYPLSWAILVARYEDPVAEWVYK